MFSLATESFQVRIEPHRRELGAVVVVAPSADQLTAFFRAARVPSFQVWEGRRRMYAHLEAALLPLALANIAARRAIPSSLLQTVSAPGGVQ